MGARYRLPSVLATLAIVLLADKPAHADNTIGKQIFEERCALCHQADAGGAEGVAPSLVGTLADYPATDKGRQYLSQILISGMAGRITTQGHQFQGLMPSFADDLSDETIAAAINYVLGTFNGVAATGPTAPITPQTVAAARAQAPNAVDTRKLRVEIAGGAP